MTQTGSDVTESETSLECSLFRQTRGKECLLVGQSWTVRQADNIQLLTHYQVNTAVKSHSTVN